jgi:hypothetical protein
MANINVNVQYDYSINILGDFSGGTAPAGAIAPHPVAVSTSTGLTGNTVTDLSAITIGGFNGLNN